MEFLYILLLLVFIVYEKVTRNQVQRQESTEQIEIGSNRFNNRNDEAFMKRYKRTITKWEVKENHK